MGNCYDWTNHQAACQTAYCRPLEQILISVWFCPLALKRTGIWKLWQESHILLWFQNHGLFQLLSYYQYAMWINHCVNKIGSPKVKAEVIRVIWLWTWETVSVSVLCSIFLSIFLCVEQSAVLSSYKWKIKTKVRLIVLFNLLALFALSFMLS